MVSTEERAREHLADLRRLTAAQVGPASPEGLVETCPRLIALAESLGDFVAKAEGWHQLGVGWARLGDFERARDAYVEAVKIWESMGETDRELRSRQGLIQALEQMGEPDNALSQAELVANARDWFVRCTGLIGIAAIQHLLGDGASALEYIGRAEQILVSSDANPRQAAYLRAYLAGNRVNVHLDAGDLEAALDEANQMSAAAALCENRPQAMEALINIGLARTRMGDLAEGWQCLNQALQAASLAGDRLRESTANWALSEWFSLAGLLESAVSHGVAARNVAASCKARFSELYSCLCLAGAYIEAGEPAKAQEPVDETLQGAQRLKAAHHALAARLLNGRIALCEGRSGEARTLLEQCVADAPTVGALALGAEASVHLARALLIDDAAQMALDHASRATDAAKRQGNKHIQWAANHAGALACRLLGQVDEALVRFREAVRLAESMWWPLWRVGFAEVKDIKPSVVALYLDYLGTASEAGQCDEVTRVLSVSPWPFLRERWERGQSSDASGGPAVRGASP